MRLIPPINRKVKIAVVTLGRLALGVTMIVLGFMRACNPIIGSYMVSDYLHAAGLQFFTPLSLLLTVAFAAIEFAIGIGSLLGTNIKRTSFYTMLFLAFLTPFSFYTAYFSTVAGDNQIAGIPMNDRVTCWTNLVSLIIAINLYVWREYSKTVFTNRTAWTIGPTCLMFSAIVSVISYVQLPLVDRTPYQPGVSMSTLMAPDTLTQHDFLWDEHNRFVISNPHKIILDGDDSKITNAIQLYSEGEGDVTRKILLQQGYTFLLVAEDLSTASTSARMQLNDLYDYTRENGYHFYCLTTSNPKSAETEEYCVESGGAEYPFVNADGRELRKMVQSKPGLLLLKDGVICDKWSDFNIPSFETKLEDSDSARPRVESTRRKTVNLIGNFILILLVILAIDWALGLLKWIWTKLFGKKEEKEANKQEGTQPEQVPDSHTQDEGKDK